MDRHSLSQIDLLARTAVCSVCGPTEIHVTRPRAEKPPKASCILWYNAYQLHLLTWRQRRKSAGRPRHILGEIDEGNCTAVCAICGPTDVYRFNSNGSVHYRCATHVRALARQEGGLHLLNPNARVHILSEIDEDKGTATCAKCGPVRIERSSDPSFAAGHAGAGPGSLVHEYKRRHVCKRCRAMAILEPGRFDFFEMHLPPEQRISVLIKTAGPEELVAELEKRDLYCPQCLDLLRHAFANNTPVPEFRPFPTLF
jgi:hypothetical protein